MIKGLKTLYRRLPLVRELRGIRDTLQQIHAFEPNIRRLEAVAVMLALKSVQSSDPRYQDGQHVLLESF